jgi:hypothetical protein
MQKPDLGAAFRILTLTAAIALHQVPAVADCWAIRDCDACGLGQYDYIEKDATTYIKIKTDWTSWSPNSAGAWIDIDGEGHWREAFYEAEGDDAGNCDAKRLDTPDLDSSWWASDKWTAGGNIDIYLKANDGNRAFYDNDWMIVDVEKSDVSGDLQKHEEPHLVLQFYIDAGSNPGRKLTRLWVANAGSMQEGQDIANGGVTLYYESGTTFDFDGDESSVVLYGDHNFNATDNEVWGRNDLAGNNINIPSDGNRLLCYICITDYAPGLVYERTAKFKIINDGISLDAYGGWDKKLVRINEHENGDAQTLYEATRGMLYLIR